jgi:hypothetical protein
MFNKIIKWFTTNAYILLVLSLIVLGNVVYYWLPKPNFTGEFKEGIQNRLVWSVKGECYFAKPLNGTDVLLVRVTDCDKISK